MTISRRQLVTRGTLAAGAAWATPVVAGAATAAAAAASCKPINIYIDWESAQYVRQSSTSAYYLVPLSDGRTLRIDIKSTFYGYMTPGGYADSGTGGTANDQLRLTPFNVGGTGDQGIAFHQYYNYGAYDSYGRWVGWSRGQRTDRQTTTFTFSIPLQTLTFQVTDIDSVAGDFRDAVDLTSASPYTTTRGSGISGTGTASDPWRSAYGTSYDNASGAGNVRVTFGSGVQSFSLSYWNLYSYYNSAYNQPLDTDQRIFITDFSATLAPVGC